MRWVHESAELGAHRLGHAIALGVDPDAYGVHRRRETVSERLDQIAYVRFASVYREFRDVDHFMDEIKKVLESRKGTE